MEISEEAVFLQKNKRALSYLAFDSAKTRGRKDKAQDNDSWLYGLLDPFAVDQQKIERSKAWRRLSGKTQVFSLQLNPYVRTRQSHTQEVVSNAALIAQVLGLNIDLCVSIAKAHDVGHLPFGHAGERFMEEVVGRPFSHAIYGAIVLQEVERGGKANFSFEVLEGITYHSGGSWPSALPQEYRVGYWADKIAYVSHDINDAVRKEMLRLPSSELANLGSTHRERTEKCLVALLAESAYSKKISFEYSNEAIAFQKVKDWLFENVYYKIDDGPCFSLLKTVYEFLYEETKKEESIFFNIDPVILLSLMTDWECKQLYESLISRLPNPAGGLGIVEIAPSIRGKKIDWESPDFSWAKNK
ncbi:MAG TPA: HD domain-containing protein [Candidatus Portnoybacteria bacterium]|nr:HD domain-containing protein [Candidatus Portnoybacteria bacterium]